MSLTWHIVRKDLRRMALPVGLWVAFVAVGGVWFRTMHLTEESIRANELYRWITGMGNYMWWMVAMQVVTSVLLAGQLVLEDSVVGTTAFWQTRPLSRGRLLVAKLIAGGLLLAVAPTLALAPLWLVSGFSFGELTMAGAEFAAWQLVIVVISFGFASLAKSLAQFFFVAVGVSVVFVIAASPAGGTWWDSDPGLEVAKTRQMLTFLLPLPLMAFVLGHQYLTRRTRRGCLIVATGVMLILALRFSWPVYLPPLLPASFHKTWPTAERGEDLAGSIALEKIVTPFDRNLPQAVAVKIAGGPMADGFLAPQMAEGSLRWPARRVALVGLFRGGRWGEEAALRLAGFKRDEGPIEWDLATRIHGVADMPAPAGEPEFAGQIKLTRMSGRVLAELPLRAGARASVGASNLRIVGLIEGGHGERSSVIVEERDSLFVGNVGLTGGRAAREADDTRQDCYLLANRALGVVKSLQIVETGSVNMCSLLVSLRQLEFFVPASGVQGKEIELAGWRDGAVLIKVRFEGGRRLSRNVTTARVAWVAEEDKQ